MTATPIFQGAATALITPMNASGVDYGQLGQIGRASCRERVLPTV